MINRIKYAYLGALGLPILLLPTAAVFTMGGHSFMFISVLGSPLGLIGGLYYSDKKRNFQQTANYIRSISGFVVYILTVIIIAKICDLSSSPFLTNQGWVVIPVISPLLAAVLTERLLKSKTQINATHDT